MLSWVLHVTGMGTLAFVFVLSVLHKLRAYGRFQASLGAYRLVPSTWLPIVAPLVIGLEMAAIVAIVVPVGPGALLAGALLTVYTAALAINLARGNTLIDCGCGDAPTPISGWLLLRNGVLLLLTVPPEAQVAVPGPVAWSLVVALVVILSTFYLIIEQLLANQYLLDGGP
jgi:hypothetical protein